VRNGDQLYHHLLTDRDKLVLNYSEEFL